VTRCCKASLLLLAVAVAGCQSRGNGPGPTDPDHTFAGSSQQNEPVWLEQPPSPLNPVPPRDIWERIRSGFKLQDEIGVNPRIEQQRLWFVSNPSFLESATQRGSLYIHYVVERLEERDMPLELALLPVIESAYDPFAYSRSDAVGLWQFIPSTGRNYNLRQTHWYDGRRDITASTNAALDYLSRLHDMFNGDWLLALAAYNAGEGTVSRAIERNQKLGLPTDYWNLPLPQETRDYVPKLLALSEVVMSPDAYGVNLNPIANEPYFQVVQNKQHLDLSQIAEMANLDADELYQLNPAYTQRITQDGPQQLLVPMDKADTLAASLATMKARTPVEWQEYRVRSGDSLERVARRYDVTVAAIKEVNRLRSNHLRANQSLVIPAASGQPSYAEAPSRLAARNYRVKEGDNLWQIAKINGVQVADLQSWNKLKGRDLQVGQVLALQAPAGPTAAPERTKRPPVTYYRVKPGDSLYQIAKRFNVDLANLRNWNALASNDLTPGQTLTLHLP
jgi:membrane-bound lytic murein transglycosylase D